MFYDKKSKLKSIKYKKFNCSPFSNMNLEKNEKLLKLNESVLTYNYNFNDGSLKDGLGINFAPIRYGADNYDDEKILIPPEGEEFDSFWLFNYWYGSGLVNIVLLAYTKSGNFYYHILHNYGETFTKCGNLNFKERPMVTSAIIDGRDYLILVSQTDGMFKWNLSCPDGEKIESNEKICSICYVYDKLFITTFNKRDTVYYSDTANPIDFSLKNENIKSFEFKDGLGQVKKLIAFKGCLYIFREFNIVKVLYDNEKDVFECKQIFGGNSYIFENTIAICGDKVIYLSLDGLYVFDGNKCEKLNVSFNKFLKSKANNYAFGGFVGGDYYLACTLDFFDGELIGNENQLMSKNNSLIKFNLESGDYSILRGVDIVSMSLLNDRFDTNVFVSCKTGTKNNIYSYFGAVDMSGCVNNIPTKKVWKTPMFDFGDSYNYKIIKDMTIETSSDCQVKFEYDGKEKIINISGKKEPQKISLYLKVKNMSITFISNLNNVEIINPILNVGFISNA